MVKYYEEIPDFAISWIQEQKIFWVATAPLTPDGHVNVSPKGIFEGSFNIVNPNRVWYEDFTGSGVETIAHLRENGRITVMFSAFDGPPRICRMFGKGTVYEFDTPQYNALISPDKRQPGSRAVIMVDIYQVSTSCGYSIPFYSFEGYRLKLHAWAVQRQNADIEAEEKVLASGDSDSASPVDPAVPDPENGLRRYWRERNTKSLDGLPGLRSAPQSRTRFLPIDPNTVQDKQPSRLAASWINSQTAIAFTLGLATSATLLRVFQQQR